MTGGPATRAISGIRRATTLRLAHEGASVLAADVDGAGAGVSLLLLGEPAIDD
jgi:NAD(P)-dependent dehydrogenase (short-subunit alcohol dehydrogenase family)